MGDMIYGYPDSDVLKNKLGIMNQEKNRAMPENEKPPARPVVLYFAIRQEN